MAAGALFYGNCRGGTYLMRAAVLSRMAGRNRRDRSHVGAFLKERHVRLVAQGS
jgi:hypothetical protein